MLSKCRARRVPGCAPAGLAWEAACPAGWAGLAKSSLSAVTRLLTGCWMVPADLFLEGPGGAILCPALPRKSFLNEIKPHRDQHSMVQVKGSWQAYKPNLGG